MKINVLELARDPNCDLNEFLKGHSNCAKGSVNIRRDICQDGFVMDGSSTGRGTIAFPIATQIQTLQITLQFDHGGRLFEGPQTESFPEAFGFGVCHEFVQGPRGDMPAYRGPLWAFLLPRGNQPGMVFSYNPRVNANETYIQHSEIPPDVKLGQMLEFSLSVNGTSQTLTTPWAEHTRDWKEEYPDGCLAFELQNGGALTVTSIIAEVGSPAGTP